MTSIITLAIVELVTGLAGFLIVGFQFSWWGAIAVFLINWSLLAHMDVRRLLRERKSFEAILEDELEKEIGRV